MRARIIAVSFLLFWVGAGWGISQLLFGTTARGPVSAMVKPVIVQSAQAAPAPAASVSSVSPVANTSVSPIIHQREQAQRARRLHQVAAETTPNGGPGEACFDQVRTAMCPIVGQIPFLREFAGQMAILGNFSCPTESQPKRG